jgi:hypothetical protein
MLKIDDDIASIIMSLLNYDMKTSYAVLGVQLSQIEHPYLAFQTTKMLGFAAGLNVPKVSIDYISEGYDFLKTLWPKLIPPICRWWQTNKGRERKELVKGTCGVITYVLPPPYNLIQGLVLIISVIVIKYGLDKICIHKTIQPPYP